MTGTPAVIARKTDEKGFVKFCAPLIGLPVSHVWQGAGTALFLEFGQLHPQTRPNGEIGNPYGEMGLMIQWSWRIERPRSILCGSWSEGRLFRKALVDPLHASVSGVSLFGRLHEIEIALSNRLKIVSFSTVEGGPHWALFHRGTRSWAAARLGSLWVEKNAGGRTP